MRLSSLGSVEWYRIYSHASFRVSELFVITNQMLLVPGVLLHTLIILKTLEHDLAETVEVGDIGHLRIKQLSHQSTSLALIVDLRRLSAENQKLMGRLIEIKVEIESDVKMPT